MTLSRRTMLRAGAAASGALALLRGQKAFANDGCEDPIGPTRGGRGNVLYDETLSYNELFGDPPLLGRVEYRQPIYADLEDRSLANVVRTIFYDEVIPIYGTIKAEPPASLPHNDVWFITEDGYVHSSFVVPVTEHFNEPEAVTGDGFWGEITVPTSWQHWSPSLSSRRYYDFAWGAVFRVIDRENDPCGRAWYRLHDDANSGSRWWVQASHVRRIHPSETTPINPGVPPEDKRIEVIINEQRLICLERGTPVFSTRIASGTTFWDTSGTAHAFHTPWGEHYVQRKTPSRHMAGGEDINDAFDLPGVPWCTFFTFTGAAIHGTYWHNDYGTPRSHGCVNVTPDAARWIYRWVNPQVEHEDRYYWTEDDERDHATIINVTPEGPA